MLQPSKLTKSRTEWREKAGSRGARIREFKKSQKRHLEKIAALKKQNKELMETDIAKKIEKLERQNSELKEENEAIKKRITNG